MKSKISVILFLVLISALTFQTASAAQSRIQADTANFPEGTTIFVDDGNTSGMEDGTATYPFNTIQEGINIAVSGDVVGVAPGTYYENVALKAGVYLVGKEPTSTIIDGSGWGTVVSMGNASLLKGFTIQHGRASWGAGIVTMGSPTIMNNIIRDNAQTSGGAGAAIHGNGSSPVIISNLITGNTADTQFLSGAVSFINSSSPYIANNAIRNNSGRGAINITVPTGNKPVVINNTIVNNSGAGIKIDMRVNQSAILVANNILTGNTTGIQMDFGTSANLPTFKHNDIFGNSTNYVGMADVSGINGNLSVDPLFSAEFRLSYSSPLIDAGSPAEYPDSDFDGDHRPFDGDNDGAAISDIGADEQMLADITAPTILVTLTQANNIPYVGDTWTNQTVVAEFTCADDDSGIASCPADQVFSADGITPLTTVIVADQAGNSATASFGPIKIDKTPPSLLIVVSPNPVILHSNIELSTSASDSLSGIKPGPVFCSGLDTTTVGNKSTTCSVSDYAGNTATTTAAYRVIYDFEGFLQPLIDCVNNPCDSYAISSFRAGSVIALKFRLKDANGNIVRPTNAPLWLVPIKIEGTPPVSFPDDYDFQVTNTAYQWNSTQNAYVYRWNTKGLPKRTSWLVGTRLDDGMTYYVFVTLR